MKINNLFPEATKPCRDGLLMKFDIPVHDLVPISVAFCAKLPKAGLFNNVPSRT